MLVIHNHCLGHVFDLLAWRLYRGNTIIREWYHFLPAFAYVFQQSFFPLCLLHKGLTVFVNEVTKYFKVYHLFPCVYYSCLQSFQILRKLARSLSNSRSNTCYLLMVPSQYSVAVSYVCTFCYRSCYSELTWCLGRLCSKIVAFSGFLHI